MTSKLKKNFTQSEFRKIRAGIVLLKRTIVVLLSLLVVCFIIALATKPESAASKYADSTVPNDIAVCGTDVSNLKYTEVFSLVSNKAKEKLISVSITIANNSKSYVLTADSLGMYIDVQSVVNAAYSKQSTETLTLSYDETKLLDNVNYMGQLFNTAPIEPKAVPDSLSSTPEFTFVEGINGYELDKEFLVNEIKSCLAENRLNALIEPKFRSVEPTQSMTELQANTVFRSTFQSSYGASSSLHEPNRMINIIKAAKKLNGCVVMPGQEFSFNDFIGPRTYDLGWAPAPGIVDGSTYEDQAGGGICQVSSTLHIALMRSGGEIDITVRKNHSWPSSYIDTGLDATVSTGGPDLQFVNNTGSPLYIFAYADNVKYTMDVMIYGKPLPANTTYVVRAEIDEVVDPDPTITVEVPEWPKGYKETVKSSRKGYRTTAYRDTVVNGEVVETVKLFNYYYRPKQGEVHVGTGSPTLPKP